MDTIVKLIDKCIHSIWSQRDPRGKISYGALRDVINELLASASAIKVSLPDEIWKLRSHLEKAQAESPDDDRLYDAREILEYFWDGRRASELGLMYAQGEG